MQKTIWESRRSVIPLEIISIFLIILASLALWGPGFAHAIAPGKAAAPLANCAPVGDITSQSLLVVLLDRSGSLVYQPGATDPDGYSTSVTKALADLWPGQMAVIPFSNADTPVIGPYPMSDANQRQLLKDRVQAYPIGGATPLDPAMQQALVLLKDAPRGSRAIIVTDGSPDPTVINGVNQADDIRQNLVPRFCSQGITVSTFGLALDLSQSDGQGANRLLSDIANGSGGIYTNVRDAKELAKVVVNLYAQWQHLTFQLARASGSGYVIGIDTYAKRVTFVAFRGSATSAITLSGPDGQPIPGQSLQRSIDRHYEIDNMALSDINQPGTYTINVSSDRHAQVYALVESRLHAILMQPSTSTIAYIGQPLQIQAELLDGSTPVLPKANEATMNAQVQVLVGEQVVSTTSVELAQANNSPVFTGQIKLPGPVGQAHIQIEAVYLQLPVEVSQTQITIPLEKPTPVVAKRPKAPTPDLLTRYGGALIGGLIALLLLVPLFLFLRRKRKSEGWELVQAGHIVDLGTMGRPLGRSLFHRSTISSRELETHGSLDFCGAEFVLVFEGNARLVVTGDEPKVTVRQTGRTVLVPRGQGTELTDKDSIMVQGCKPATLHLQVS